MCLNLVIEAIMGALELYYKFIVKEKHEVNKQTLDFLIKEHIKELMVGMLLAVPIMALTVRIVNTCDYFIYYLWFFSIVVDFVGL